jgi:hypothetical protein
MRLLLKKDIKPSDIITKKSLDNAVRLVTILGGSTNAVLHFLAIARAAAIDFSLQDFQHISDTTPFLADLKPSGKYLMEDVHRVGGIPAVLKYLLKNGLLHGDCLTVTGKTLAENLENVPDLEEGQDVIKDVQIFTVGEHGDDKGKVIRDITANHGKLLVDKKLKTLTIALFDCNIVDKKSKPAVRAFNKKVEFVINYGKEMNSIEIGKRDKYMTLKELFGCIRIEKKFKRETCDLEVELNQRIAFALAPIAFMLLGLPLAIRTSRRETSVGLFLSVVLAGGFFLTIILCESLTAYPQLYPQYLLWIPNLAYQLGGAYMIYKIAKH